MQSWLSNAMSKIIVIECLLWINFAFRGGGGRAAQNELKFFGWVAEGTTRYYNFIHSSFISFSSSSILHDLRRTRRRTGNVPRSQILSQKVQHPMLSIHCTRTASEPRAMHVWSVVDGLTASKKEQWPWRKGIARQCTGEHAQLALAYVKSDHFHQPCKTSPVNKSIKT